MSVLGLSGLEEAVYRYLLRNPGSGGQRIQLELCATRRDVARALTRLSGLGLLHEAAHQNFVPADPQVTVDRLISLRLRGLYEEVGHVTRARSVVGALRAEQNIAAEAELSMERVEGVTQIRERIEDLAFFTRKEVLSLEPGVRLAEVIREHTRPLDTRWLNRGVQLRRVVHEKALVDSYTADYFRELAAQGAEIRVADELPEPLFAFDRQAAVVSAAPGASAMRAVVVREAGLVSTAVTLFEKVWEGAADLLDVDGVRNESGVAQDRPSKVERRVLETMCRVGKDEAGARDLGMSVRTYRRHIAGLLDRLGANSRAHAALLARERDWI
ncbi:response regulator transcription factor [Streptomyces sporangiiformans]|uniref:Response regulator transcription factor n=1 Tax=Streptomyces sporangiiformans TaxID=2315329 RepID=A0A505DL04_9ACTN|nr:response regulator transcription factor [Streptomyces sporangiiformans]TPQ20776.1 response regulator transcription factor [Streptomyces sporangiiformans]